MAEETSAPNQILCPYCKRLITLPALTFGSKEKCPHCDIDFVVSSRLIHQASDESEEEDVTGGYGVQVKIPEKVPGKAPLSMANVLEEDAEEAGKKASWRPMETPPLGLFFKGTFVFPFTAGPCGWYLTLFFLCCAVEAGVLLAIYLAGFSGGWEIAGNWIACMILIAITIIIGVFTLLLASSICLVILRDTSNGIHKFKNQQIGWFTDWAGEAVYMAFSLFWGAAPAMILVFLLPIKLEARAPIYLFFETCLFPIFLMSALECKSPAMPYSKPVWKSLYYAWHAWALFYLLTLLIGETFVYLLRVVPFETIYIELAFVSGFLPFLLIVYFRLLGRLAWFCSGQFHEDIRLRRMEVGTRDED